MTLFVFVGVHQMAQEAILLFRLSRTNCRAVAIMVVTAPLICMTSSRLAQGAWGTPRMNVKTLLTASLGCAFLLAAVPMVRALGSHRNCPYVSCGPQSLLAVCRRLGVEADLDEVGRLSGFDKKTGTTMLGLKRAAEAKGLHAVGMKIGLTELSALAVPAIAQLWDNHFVVVENSENANQFKITDPPHEPQLIPHEDFGKAYSGFALLIAKDESLFPKPEESGPDLRFDAYSFDFGFIEEGKQVGHSFAYENKGTEELVLLKVEATCGCTQAFLSEEKRIPPGGKGELVVGFDSTRRQGGESQIVYVHSNDPISPIVQLEIGGVIKPIRLPISVRSLHFGTVKRRDGAKREIVIRDPGDGSLAVNEVTCDSPSVKVSLTRTDKPDLVYLVTAELKPGAPVGELKGKIKVSTNHPREPVVEIPVAADVVGDIETFPNQFFLGLLKKGQTASKTITISTTSDKPLVIRKMDSPFDYVTITALTDIRGKKYSVTATLKDTAPLGNIKGEVVIHTNAPDQREIRVRIYAYVEDQG